MRLLLLIVALLSAVSLFLLIWASANTSLFTEYYALLLRLNIVAAVSLILLVLYQIYTLWHEYRARIFGSRLKLRLMLMLTLMAVLPGTIVYAVSVQFATRSIESWFDVRVDAALEGGLNLGRSAFDYLANDLTGKARVMAQELANTSSLSNASQGRLLNQLREQMGVKTATLFSSSGQIIVTSSSDVSVLLRALPAPSELRQARKQGSYHIIEGDPGNDDGFVIRALVTVATVTTASLSHEPLVLQLVQPVPEQLAHNAASVQAVYRDYQALSLGREGLKRIYTMTLTFTLLLAFFAAMALAFLFSRRLSAPLSILAEGTQAVAEGDFSPRQALATRDELGILTQSFSRMTRQLDEARVQAEKNRLEVEVAQRAAAWGEVAQRLAHEIKNPLTPIQLSAERLQMKLEDKLEAPEREFLSRLTQTIINQVEAMKNMVNDFRDYARLPAPTLLPLDLNSIINEVLSLYEGSRLSIQTKLATSLSLIMGDATQLRQVMHNLLKNAEDILVEHSNPIVQVMTYAEGDGVWLTVQDNGEGFPAQVLARIFEPYMTTKARGTGLGLAIVKKIVDEHHGKIHVVNRDNIEDKEERGAEVRIWLRVAAVSFGNS